MTHIVRLRPEKEHQLNILGHVVYMKLLVNIEPFFTPVSHNYVRDIANSGIFLSQTDNQITININLNEFLFL